MSVRDELHKLADQLEDEAASKVFDYARSVAHGEESDHDSALARLNRRMGPSMVSGREFLHTYRQPKDFATLAAEQGVRLITSPDDLRADFWPEDESIDEFVETIRQWRREGG